ncbi:MAG: hypothetical protein JWR09_5480 [Mucilaginibacter sp.]|nr:hypothetical protein [Mucilaginibacter sp.]
MKTPYLLLLLLFVTIIESCSPSVGNQVFYQPVQKDNQANYAKYVVRIYMDKFGYYYPSTAINIDTGDFFFQHDKKTFDTDTSGGNLFAYFTKHREKINELGSYYHVPEDKDSCKVYNLVEKAIIKAYADSIDARIRALHADQLVFLIHGFNCSDATESFKEIRDTISSYGYDKNSHNVYVELYWEGLQNLEVRAGSAIPIWAHAQNNSIYVGLSLRNFLRSIPDSIPLVFLSHSLGASVATEALFNTTRKWSGAPDVNDAEELKRLIKTTPTPGHHRIRLVMLAPAIPGEMTFLDFEARTPTHITAVQNNIYPIVLGYNPKDYAVSKRFLAAKVGTTTLGSNYKWHGQYEIDRVKALLVDSLGYTSTGANNLIRAVHFTTKLQIKPLGLQDHAVHSYLNFDPKVTHEFFDQLFKN